MKSEPTLRLERLVSGGCGILALLLVILGTSIELWVPHAHLCSGFICFSRDQNQAASQATGPLARP